MRTIFITFLLTASGSFAYTQTTSVCMTYDLAGNRTERLTCGAGLNDPNDETRATAENITERDGKTGDMMPVKGQIVPNPNDGHFEVVLSRLVENGRFEIYNTQGELILQQNPSGERNAFHLQDAPSGNYYLALKSEGKLLGQWIILKN